MDDKQKFEEKNQHLKKKNLEDNFYIFHNSNTEKLCITDGEVQACTTLPAGY